LANSQNLSPADADTPTNPHRRPSAHRLPAGSFFGGFRTPARRPYTGSTARARPASETLNDPARRPYTGSTARARPASETLNDSERICRYLKSTAQVKGFGWRPIVIYRCALRAGVRKPPRKEPAGGRVSGCRLWGFDGAAAWVGDALAGVVGIGLTIAVPGSSSRRRSTGRYWPDRTCKRWLRRRRSDSGAMPEARFPGQQL
jgi:hypothetical protein